MASECKRNWAITFPTKHLKDAEEGKKEKIEKL